MTNEELEHKLFLMEGVLAHLSHKVDFTCRELVILNFNFSEAEESKLDNLFRAVVDEGKRITLAEFTARVNAALKRDIACAGVKHIIAGYETIWSKATDLIEWKNN